MWNANPNISRGQNDDNLLGDQFDACLTQMITELTVNLQNSSGSQQESGRGKAVIAGKHNLMQLLVEKTLDYLQMTDAACSTVVLQIRNLYEKLLDDALKLPTVFPSERSQSLEPMSTVLTARAS